MHKIAYVEVGHGERGDPGAVKGKFIEHQMNKIVAAVFTQRARLYGWKIIEEKGNLEMHENGRIANESGAAFYLSFHFNAGGGDRGEVIYAWEDGSKRLADAVAKGLKKAGQTEVRVYKSKANSAESSEYFGVLRYSKMAGVIIEPCFIDNVVDRQIADTEEKLKNIGKCIADALVTEYGGSLKKEAKNMLAKLKLDTQVNLPDVGVTLNGVKKSNSVLLNIDGKDTTYIPAVILRDVGMGVVWDSATKTVKITK